MLHRFYKEQALHQHASFESDPKHARLVSPLMLESGEASLPKQHSLISVHQRLGSQPEPSGAGSALAPWRSPKRTSFNFDGDAEKFFVGKKSSLPRHLPEGELSKVIKIAEKYKSEGFRKHMYMHSRGLAEQKAPDAITRLNAPMSKAHIQWVYDTGRADGSKQLLKRSLIRREREQVERFGPGGAPHLTKRNEG